jgi:oligopeptide transport system permease protein
MPVVILQESFLSFIGLGVNEPLTSLGQPDLRRPAAKPSAIRGCCSRRPIAMVITLFSLNFIGDGLRDAFDPKDR